MDRRRLANSATGRSIFIVNMNELEQLKSEVRETYLAYLMQRQISQFKGGFLARISHELRTPLSTLISLHQLIIHDLCEDPLEERQFILEALNSAQNLLQILDEMIVISKIDYGQIPLSLKVISLKEVLQDLFSLSYRLAENKKIKLKITLSEEDVLVETDQEKILQMLLILVEVMLGHISSGSLEILLSSDRDNNQGIISFESPQIETLLSEPWEFLQSQTIQINPADNFQISLGLKLLSVQSILQTMQGTLEIIEQGEFKLLRCLLPLRYSS